MSSCSTPARPALSAHRGREGGREGEGEGGRESELAHELTQMCVRARMHVNVYACVFVHEHILQGAADAGPAPARGVDCFCAREPVHRTSVHSVNSF